MARLSVHVPVILRKTLGVVALMGTLTLDCNEGTLAAPIRHDPKALQADGYTITVDVRTLRNHKGKVLGLLFDSSSGFPGSTGKAYAKARTSELEGGRATLRFSGVSAGVYAVAVIHDENENNRLDTNFIGIPKEGVGASNGARGTIGPPRWKDARFEVAKATRTFAVLQYL